MPGIALALALSLTGCGLSYMAGYADQTRALCVRVTLRSNEVQEAELVCPQSP